MEAEERSVGGANPVSTYRVGIIGCGRRPQETPRGLRGYGIAENHARAYEACGQTAIVAAADINPENLQDFVRRHNVPSGYTDYQEMLQREQLDIVSICTWVGTHTQICRDVAMARPRAILCEKPMALTLPDADSMLAACERNGVKLAVNHQRRLGAPFQKAKALLNDGAIGALLRLEGYVPRGTLLDWGTHWIDMFLFYLNQQPVTWVMAQADRRSDRVLFGVESEDHAIVHMQFESGVRGYLELGAEITGQPANRLLGTNGMIEVGVQGGPVLRYITWDGGGWRIIETTEGIHGIEHFHRSVREVVAAIEENREPFHNGRNARQALEVILAGYESVYRRARVELPLEVPDFPMDRLLEAWGQK
jgi:predicted dehydrogenase